QRHRQPLERHLPIPLGVERPENLSHPAPTDQLIQPVRTEQLRFPQRLPSGPAPYHPTIPRIPPGLPRRARRLSPSVPRALRSEPPRQQTSDDDREEMHTVSTAATNLTPGSGSNDEPTPTGRQRGCSGRENETGLVSEEPEDSRSTRPNPPRNRSV